jgi:PAS domain S-box-containing protein
LKYFGAAGKPGGKRRKQTSTYISGETGLLDSKISAMKDEAKTKKQLIKDLVALQDRCTEEAREHYYDIGTAVNALLRLSLEDYSLEELLRKALDIILSVSSLSIETKGSIFLVEDEPEVLIQKVQKGLAEALLKECARVPFGKCLCGRAASIKRIVFADHIDERHEVGYEGTAPHGHYCVPILLSGNTIGVINLYLKDGHSRVGREEDFLDSVANTLAGIIKSKRAEEALQESEERYRQVADFTYAWEYWLAPDGKYVYVSPACERISGYRVEEFLQDPKLLEKITHPDDKRRLAVHIRDVLQGKSDVCELEFRIITRNNEDRWIGHECRGVYGRNGAYMGRRGSNRDITNRKKAEEELKGKDKFLESMVQSSAVATFVVNAEHKVIYWNRACEDLTGMKSEDLLGTSDHWKAFYDHPRPCVADVIIDNKINEMTNFYKVYARSVLIPDGIRAEGWYPNLGGKNRYIVFDAAPIRDDNGKITAAIETLQDITKRKQAEDALQEGQRQLKAILDNIPDIAWLKDKENRFIAVNEPFGKSCGFEPEHLVGKTDFDIWPRDLAERYRADDKEVMESGKRKQVEEPLTDSDGKSLWIETIKTPIYDAHGNVAGTAGIARDITRHKEAEEQLQHTLESLRKAFGTTVQVMVSAVESRDPYTAGHQIRSTDLARAIAKETGLSQDKIDGIRMAGVIHDIGKLSVPAEILSKPTKLSENEFSLIKEHANKGFEMLKDVESPWPMAEIVYQHHERMDGSGYPRHLKGEEILMEARILAVADVVESMASHRPYRPALGIDAALEEIEKNKGILYDAEAVDACLRLFREKGFQLEGTRF